MSLKSLITGFGDLRCIGIRNYEALMVASEAIKENTAQRLQTVLEQESIDPEDINRAHLLHTAAWLGHTHCVQLLIEHGADPDQPHRKNGCTPLHLANFCTVDESHPKTTINALTDAGADVNSQGGEKCGIRAIDHAIQHQKFDSARELIVRGSTLSLQSLLTAVDVVNPELVELLLISGAQCGKMLPSIRLWGQPLNRVISTPLKSPRECYKRMFTIVVQATVCQPILSAQPAKSEKSTIEEDIKRVLEGNASVASYLLVHLIRNSFRPSQSLLEACHEKCPGLEWVDQFLSSVPSMKDLCIRHVRSRLYLYGNIMYALEMLGVPQNLKDIILMKNPL